MKMTSSLFITTLLGLSLHFAPVQGQVVGTTCLTCIARTWVSSLGNDSNDCNRLTPCRTFQRAHDQTLTLGEITVLDPGGYGAVTITKGISIINDGVGEAGVLVSGGLSGITINAGSDDVITLRGLTIKGIGFGGGNGVVFNSGKALSVENCTIRNLTGINPIGNGLVLQPSGPSTFAITNTAITDNRNKGIRVTPGSGVFYVAGVLDRVGLYNNGQEGLVLEGNGQTLAFSVTDSVASANLIGFSAVDGARLLLQRSAAVTNGIGVASSGALVIVNQSVVYNNTEGWKGQIASYGNNVVAGNTSNEGAMSMFTPR
jgi:hypothetical protein